MASFKLVFLIFILVSFVHFATTKAQDFHFLSYSCLVNATTPNSPFQLNLRTLFNYLSSNATAGKKEFYETSVIGRNHSDTVYGRFMCRGDIPSQLRGQCVSNATQPYMSSNPPGDLVCFLSIEAVIMYDECTVGYSNNRSFFSNVDLTPFSSCMMSSNASASFERVLFDTMNKTAEEAASSPIHAKKYATKQARISGFQTLYSLAQCTPDLSPHDCGSCLNATIAQLLQLGCNGNEGNSVSRSCYIKYAFHPLYRPSKDSGSYLSHNCSSKLETVIANSAFLSNLKTLLSSLSSNATSKAGFYKATIHGGDPSDTVHGLFMCRGDVSPSVCQRCVQNATERISSECSSSKEAIIWYNHCLLRYSYRSFPSTGDTSPMFYDFNIALTSNGNQEQSQSFTTTLERTLSKVVETATSESRTTKNYGTAAEKPNDFQPLYALGQCTPDLDRRDCYNCLQNIIDSKIPWCCLASPEGKALYPSCYMMFGLSRFDGDGDKSEALSPAAPPRGTTGKKKGSSQAILLTVVLSLTVVAVMLIYFGCNMLGRKKKKTELS